MKDRETLDVYATRAQDYADRFAKGGASKHLRAFIDDLPEGGRVLDLGCGPGQAAAILKKQGFNVDAWDAAREMAKVGRKTFGLGIEVRGFETLDAVALYDGIYANFSLLHASKADMPNHLVCISRALKPGGIFHIGLKSGVGEARDSIGRFYAYYTETELTGLLDRVGLSVFSLEAGSDVGLAGSDDPWMILRARKND